LNNYFKNLEKDHTLSAYHILECHTIIYLYITQNMYNQILNTGTLKYVYSSDNCPSLKKIKKNMYN